MPESVKESVNKKDNLQGIGGWFLFFLILSGLIAVFWPFYIALNLFPKAPILNLVILISVISSLHIATVVLAILKNKACRIVGIIAWIPLILPLFFVGLAGILYYILSKRVKNTLKIELTAENQVGFGGRFILAIMLSIVYAIVFLSYSIIKIQELGFGGLIIALIIAGLHIATIVLVLQKKKIGRTVGIITWAICAPSLIGLWVLLFYIKNNRVKNTLIK